LIREFAAGLEVSASGKKQIQKMPFAELEAALVKKYGSRQVLDSILEQLHPAGEKTQKPPEPAPEAPAPKPPAPEAPPPAPKPPEAAPKEAGKTGYENVPLERVKKDAAAGVKSAQQELQVRTAAHPEPAKPAEAPEPAKTPFKTGAARKAKIKELLDQGRSYAEIAAEIGVSKQRVGQIAKTEGWAEAKKEASQAAARESGVQRGTEEQAGEAGFSAPAELRDRTPQEIHEENVDRLADYITNARKAGSTDPELARLEAFHGRQAFTPAGPKAMKKILAKAAEIELAAYNEKAVRDAQQSVQRSEHEATPLSREDIAQAHERSDAQQAELRAEAERVAALKQSGGTAEPAPGAPNPPVPGGVNEPLPPQQYREQGGTMGGGALIPVGGERQTAPAHKPAGELRASEGLQLIEKQASQSFKEVWEAARKENADNPKAASELAREVVEKAGKRAVTAEEEALLAHRAISVRNQLENKKAEAADGKAVDWSDRKFRDYNETMKELIAERDLVDRALHWAGSETGRTLAFRRQLIQFDYSLGSLIGRMEAAAKRELTKGPGGEREKVEQLAKQIEELTAALDKANAEKVAALQERANQGDVEAAKEAQIRQADPERLASPEGFQLDQAKRQVEGMVTKLHEEAQPAHVRYMKKIFDVANISRSLMTIIDFPLFRQGWIASLSHPFRTAKAVPEMLKAFGSKESAEKAMYEIEHHPDFKLFKEAGGEFTDWRSPVADENFGSSILRHVPLVERSEQAYHVVLNRLRIESFSEMANTLRAKDALTMGDARILANYANVMTGRGNLGAAQKAAETLSQVFFAPKWAVSRWQYLLGQPIWTGIGKEGLRPETRKLIATEYARFAAGVGVVAALAVAAGFKLETDLRSTDFGKIRLGDTRLDISGALHGPIVLTSRLLSGQMRTQAGALRPIRGNVPFGGTTGADLISNYVRGKLALIPSTAIDLAGGKDVTGKPVSVYGRAESLVTPLFVRDVFDAYQDLGIPRATAVSLLGLGGMGMQTYQTGRRQEEVGPIRQLFRSVSR
jgi:hypothetical protein